MDAAEALAELMELSSQIESAVVLDAGGSVLAATGEDPASRALATSGLELVRAAFELGSPPQDVTRVEVELDEGALFVLHEGDHTIAATTGPEPTSGLVVYDLRTCLQGIDEAPPEGKRAARKPRRSGE